MSKSYIHLNPLIDTTKGVHCYLLEINNTKLLINCGTSPKVPPESYSLYTETILSCDAILITSFDNSCIGGLPYILSKNFCNNVYLTLPVKQLGSLSLQDQMKKSEADKYTDPMKAPNIIDIKYMQPAFVNDITICAFNAGNSIGNALFKISKGIEHIYVGFDINHRKEYHLDGVDLKNIHDPFLFITNTSYVYQNGTSLQKRDEHFFEYLRAALKTKKIILVTKYTRFLEVICALNSMNKENEYRILCYSRICRVFVERIKSMIEWVGSNALESLSDKSNPFDLNNIVFIEYFNMLKDFDICVILDDEFINKGNVALIEKCNNRDTLVIFTDEVREYEFRENISNLKVYSVEGKYVTHDDGGLDDNKDDTFMDSDDSIENIDRHWSVNSNEIWTLSTSRHETDALEREYNRIYCRDMLFPNNSIPVTQATSSFSRPFFYPRPRCLSYDDYGEYMNQQIFNEKMKIVEEKENKSEIQENVYVEDYTYVKTGIIPLFKTTSYDISGSSDLRSIKTIFQNLQPRKIVIVPDDQDSAKMLYYALFLKKDISSVYVLNESINLSFNSSLAITKLSPEFLTLNYKKINTDMLAQFIGCQENGYLQYLEQPKNIMVGLVDVNELKKSFLENGLSVEVRDNVVIVGNGVSIIVEDNHIIFEGGGDDLYYYVRNIFYQNVAIL